MLDLKGKIWRSTSASPVKPTWARRPALSEGVGTPGYSPPEQFGLGVTDPRSDVYSLGATMYALLTGRPPPVAVDLMTEESKLGLPSSLNPEIPAAVDRVILRMMALQREQRFQSIAEARTVMLTLPLDRRKGRPAAASQRGR